MNRSLFLALSLAAVSAPAALAATVTTFGPNDLRVSSVTELTINGQLYDAAFVYEPLDIFLSPTAFAAALPNEPTFTTEADAVTAANALIQAINDAALSQQNADRVSSLFAVPTGFGQGVDPSAVDAAPAFLEPGLTVTYETPSVFFPGLGSIAGNAGNPALVSFTLVPEPGAAALVAGGLLAGRLAAKRRRA